MKLVLIIAVGFTLSRFVSSSDDTHSISPKMRTVLTRMDRQSNGCQSKKRISPEISLSPFQVTSDAQHVVGSGMRPEQPLTIFPVSVKAFSKLGLEVLESREVCILGQKLKNIILPTDSSSQFEIMTGIAIWFSPCIQRTSHEQTRCFTRQMKRFNAIDVNQVTSLHALLSKLLEYIE